MPCSLNLRVLDVTLAQVYIDLQNSMLSDPGSSDRLRQRSGRLRQEVCEHMTILRAECREGRADPPRFAERRDHAG